MASENSDDPNFEICSLDENQVEKACEDLRVKNAELKKAINHMIKENTLYKKKYNEMKSQLTDLNKLLEKNAQVFHQLFDDAQSALQMGRTSILNSPAIHNRLSVRKANPKIPVTILPSTSNTSQSKSMTRRRLHIEPINMSELQETGENNVSTVVAEISEQPEQDSTLREGSGLSTILEENSNPSIIREVSVRLSRLDTDTVKSHLSKQNSSSDLPQQDTTAAKETGSVLSNNSSLNVDDSLTFNCYPTDTSSPFKLEVMKKLGLVPTLKPPPSSPVPNFVNVRKKNNYERKCDKLISPKKEESPQPRKKSKFLPKKEDSTNKKKKEDSTNKKKKEVPSVELKRSPRLSRRAKPQMLREESLRKKMRRD